MWGEVNRNVKGLFFKQTCVVSPEQYDVFLDGKYVAYVRCRFGKLKVCPITKEFIIPDVETISDEEYERTWKEQYMIDAVDYYKPFYFVAYDDPYKSEIPEEEFEKMADAIYRHMEKS